VTVDNEVDRYITLLLTKHAVVSGDVRRRRLHNVTAVNRRIGAATTHNVKF